MRPDGPLPVQFCDHTALIWCDEATARQSLLAYFRHCLGQAGPVVASYRIARAEEGHYQLWRDEALLHPSPTWDHLLTYLTQDITLKLITSCQQHLVFHAAGLAYGPQGVILCGRSGSGKSTLATWLTATGFDFLSDEVVAVRPDGLEMVGLPCPITLKSGSTFVWEHWLGDQAEQKGVQFFNGAGWFDPEQFRPQCVQAKTRPQLLIFPRYVEQDSLTVCPLSAAEAAFRLMHQLVNFKSWPDQGFSRVTRLVKQVTPYSLTYSEVTEAAAWLQGIVNETIAS